VLESSAMRDLTDTDKQHQLFILTLHEKLHLAPIGEGIHNVLDIATGTGIWAIDFGSYRHLLTSQVETLTSSQR
jgi:ubiquinone/menaquinone biosynthesis C-methylase UbiE